MKKILLCLIVSATVLMADFTRDDAGSIVTDNATGLQWQDDAAASAAPTAWQSAIDRCEALELGGHTDWRLPNRNELHSIVQRSRVNPAIDPVFQNVASGFYWSSSAFVSAPGLAWDVYFGLGFGGALNKTGSLYVRCVRGGQ